MSPLIPVSHWPILLHKAGTLPHFPAAHVCGLSASYGSIYSQA